MVGLLHPETKERHWQPPTTLELLAPQLNGLVTGGTIQLRDEDGRIKLVNTIRLRARLLEFLKFRVLASQQSFFEADTLLKRQQWLSSMFPEALQLSEQDLDRVWDQHVRCTRNRESTLAKAISGSGLELLQ